MYYQGALSFPCQNYIINSSPSTFNLNTASPITASQKPAPIVPEPANTVLAGPTSGVPAAPTWRPLVGNDLPFPGATSLGGVDTFSCATGFHAGNLSTSGSFGCTPDVGGGGGSGVGVPFPGPNPWFDVTNTIFAGGASGANISTTGTISASSHSLALAAALTGVANGQGVSIFHAGPNTHPVAPTDGLVAVAQGAVSSVVINNGGSGFTVGDTLKPAPFIGQRITGAAIASNVATLTVSADHKHTVQWGNR